MKQRIIKKQILETLFAFIAVFGFMTAPAMAVETYKFERMTPVLQQPWYFLTPSGLAADSKGFIYVSDLNAQCIKKFTPDGFFVTQWGTYGRNTGEFWQAVKIAIDKDDYVYVADSLNHRIQKFTSDGKFVSAWGGISESSGDGQFGNPVGLVIDNKNSVIYVADAHNHRVQKLTLNGEFLSKWGTLGTGDGQFINPYAIAMDSAGNIYVADGDRNGVVNYCIQKFSPDGSFLLRWGTQGAGAGHFQSPTGIFIDKNDLIYVTDSKNHRIQIFDANGTLKKIWGGPADLTQYQNILSQIDEFYTLFTNTLVPLLNTFQAELHADSIKKQDMIDFLVKDAKDGTFNIPMDMTIDQNGNIYVADSSNQRIQKFTSDKGLLSVWGSTRDQSGMFKNPMGIAADGNFFYVADSKSHRVQKFAKDGKFISAWGKLGLNSGEFQFPTSIAVKNGYVYVADAFNHRIQKFTTDGVFVSQWGSKGTGNGSFQIPLGIAADNNGYIYVTDLLNFRIQKFTPEGVFVKKFESAKIFGVPIDVITYTGFAGISVDNSGYIYTANMLRNCFQKFGADGKLIKEWGSKGDADGQFRTPFGIAAANGFIYVADAGNCRIQQYDINGNFLQRIGKLGSDVGQFLLSAGISLDSDGKLYVADATNNRIQIFRKGLDTEKKMKAIIVAGGGPYDGNSIWNETRMNANFAYRALTYQGFNKDSIYYLSSDTGLDLDNDGVPEVRADATNANLQAAITGWAAGADSLVIYFVDHGGDGSLRMSVSETLSASELNSWLDTAQQTIPGTLTFVYDACYSGSFLPVLAHPNRIVVSSAASDQEAWFMTKGSVSFSNYFWTHIFNGSGVKDAFDLSRNAMGYTTTRQTALLDDNGDGISDSNDGLLAQTTYIGNGIAIYADAPVIGRVSPEQTFHSDQTDTAELAACDIKSINPVSHVWAVIRPPDYRQGAGNPVTDLPSVDLQPSPDGCYKTIYSEFKTPGTYQILIYARDDKGNTSVPKQTAVIVETPLRHKAVIVAGAVQSDKWWSAVEKGVKLAYDALIFQKYSDNDIYLMSPVSIPEVGKMPMMPTLSNLQYAITSWSGTDTQDMVIYLIGNGTDGAFSINPSETLPPTILNNWLNDMQNRIPGKVVVIYDACRAASFLPFLIPPSGKERIVIASAGKDESVYFLTQGGVSFSRYFWNRIWGGATVADAFRIGRDAFRLMSCKPQTPYMDDNGNGIGNEKSDGVLAADYVIGAGIMPGDSPPSIASADILLIGKTSGIIRASVAGNADKVWAAVDICTLPTAPDIPITKLSEKTDLVYNPTSGRYEGKYDNFSEKCKTIVYAADPKGNISSPISAETITIADPPAAESPIIAPPTTAAVMLPAVSSIKARSANAFGTAAGDGITERGFYWWIEPGPAAGWGFVSGLVPEGGSGAGDFGLTLTDLKPGNTYYIRAYIKVGEQMAYSEKVSFTTPSPGIPAVHTLPASISGSDAAVKGRITDDGGMPLDVCGFVYATHPQPAIGDILLPSAAPVSGDGTFSGAIGNLSSGIYYLRAYAHNEFGTAYGEEVSFKIKTGIPGDPDGDKKADLTDAILVLKILAGIPAENVSGDADVNGDGKIGLEELVFILQQTAGLR